MWYLICAIIGYVLRPMIEMKVNVGIASIKTLIKTAIK